MQLREFYNHFLTELKPLYGYEETAAIATMIFEHFAGKNKTDIITNPQSTIEKEKMPVLENALQQLKSHVPVQYIIGHAWFAQLKFKVTPAVLIPRPETEELVNAAISYIKATHKESVLDIGTGSGCIPVSIKKQLPDIVVSAIDISAAALAVATENAVANNVSIEWIQQDFLKEKEWNTLPVYDVIISNPPYIPENEKELLDANVLSHEPSIALFVPDNKALVFYEKIAAFGKNHLVAGGCIFMETHESFAGKVAQHFLVNGYQAVVKKDFFGKERMVIANLVR